MKKIKSFLCLIFILIFAVQSSSLAAFVDTKGTKYETAIDFLTGLGVVSGYENNEFLADYGTSRGDFAVSLARIIGYTDEYVPQGVPFSDMDSKNQYTPEVDYLYHKGIIDGYADRFNADEPIKYNEAVKMAVTSIGYGGIAKMSGDYPQGYINIANNIGILKNVSVESSGIITRGNWCQLLYNMLNSDALEFDMNTPGRITYTLSDDKVLYKLYKMKEHEGTVTAVGKYSLYSEYILNENQIVIDYKVYNTTVSDIKSYFGHKVRYYTKEDGNGDENVAVIIDLSDNVLSVEDVSIDDSTTKNSVVYKYSNGKTKKAKISKDAFYIYNGRAIYSISDGDLKPEYGGVELIDNDKDGTYDVVIIKSYEIKTVEYTSDINGKIVFKDGEIPYNDDVLIYKNGKETTLNDMKYLDTVMLAKSKDGGYIECLVSDEAASGTVEDMYTDGGYTYVTVNGNAYRVANDIQLSAGKTGTFYISNNKCVAYFKEQAEYSYAYLKNCYTDETGDNLYFKVFDDKAEQKNLQSDKNILITYDNNGTKCESRYKNLSAAAKTISDYAGKGESFKAQLIRYKLNSAGNVIEVSFAMNGGISDWGKDEFTKTIDTQQLTDDGVISKSTGSVRTGYMSASVSGGKYNTLMDNDVLIFYIAGDEQDWQIMTKAQLGDANDLPSFAVYDVNEEGNPKAIVIKSSTAIEDKFEPATDPVLCIEKIYTSVDADNNLCTNIEGFSNRGNNYSCYTDKEDLQSNSVESSNQFKKFADLKKGDVVQVKLDSKNRITAFRVLYQYNEDAEFARANEGGSIEGMGMRSGVTYYGPLYYKGDSSYVLYNDATEGKKIPFLYNKQTYAVFNNGHITPISKSELYSGARVFVYTVPVHNMDFIIMYE